MDSRREQLLRMLRRHRWRLIAVCVGTALACGTAVALTAPQGLIGGEHRAGAPVAAVREIPAAGLPGDTGPLRLSAEIEMDPREVRSNLQRWAGMSQGRREALFERYWRLAELPETQRKELTDQYRAFRKESKARQEFLRSRAKELQAFLDSLSPQDQAVLKGMAPEQRARRLLELWTARYGKW